LTILTALISLCLTTTHLPGWDLSTSTIIRSWWKVSKHGWAHRQQTSLTQANKHLLPNMSVASIPVMIVFRSSVSMYVLIQ
jgi:hypothetical protein